MSRTTKKDPPRPYQKEKKCNRKVHYKVFRGKCKQAMSQENFDDIPRFSKTSGWLTW